MDHRDILFLDTVEVEREEVGTEAIRNAVFETCRCAALVRAKDPAATLFADVPKGVCVAQNWVLGVASFAVGDKRRIGLGNDELVFDGDRGDLDAEHLGGTLRVVTGRGDNVLCVDDGLFVSRNEVTALFAHLGDGDFPVIAGPLVAVDLPLTLDDHAALTCALGHRHSNVGGVDVAVLRVEQSALEVVGADQRPAFLDLRGGQEFVVDVGSFGNRGIQFVFIHTLVGLRHTQVTADREAGVQAGLFFERLVEVDRVLVDVGRRVRHVEQRQKAGCVPCRAGGQLVTLEEHDVFPASAGKVVGNGGADGATTDNKGANVRFH